MPIALQPLVKKADLKINGTKHGGKILILEDEPLVFTILSKILKKLGFSVDITENGNETVKKYKEEFDCGNPYSLIIMDLTIIGGMGGEETIREIQKIDPNAKAIVSSGYSNEDILANFEEYGFCDILVKPYSFSEIQNKLAKVLNK